MSEPGPAGAGAAAAAAPLDSDSWVELHKDELSSAQWDALYALYSVTYSALPAGTAAAANDGVAVTRNDGLGPGPQATAPSAAATAGPGAKLAPGDISEPTAAAVLAESGPGPPIFYASVGALRRASHQSVCFLEAPPPGSELRAFFLHSPLPLGCKISLVAHDGSAGSKAALMRRLASLLRQSGWMMEASGAVSWRLRARYGLEAVGDPALVKAMLDLSRRPRMPAAPTDNGPATVAAAGGPGARGGYRRGAAPAGRRPRASGRLVWNADFDPLDKAAYRYERLVLSALGGVVHRHRETLFGVPLPLPLVPAPLGPAAAAPESAVLGCAVAAPSAPDSEAAAATVTVTVTVTSFDP